MAVLGRLLIGSSERLDLPDLLSIDSFSAADFKYLMQSLVGADKPFILKGFDVIQPQDSVATESISIRVADSVVYYPGSAAGSFYVGLPEGNKASEAVVPELRKNATNFVYLTFNTFDTAQDSRAFWDPDQNGGEGGEFSQDINTESVLSVEVNVSVSSFPENTIPIAKVEVGPSVISSITDARDMMFRLGTGGLNPDPFATYDFRGSPSSTYARKETPIIMTNASQPNPFEGGDKNIRTLKEWMDVVMTKLKELGGTTFWYENAPSSVASTFSDTLGSTLKSKGEWLHDGTIPGRVTWSEDIQYKSLTDPRMIIFRGQTIDITGNEQVAWYELTRDADINGTNQAVDWFNGLNKINGAVGAFANVSKGDWIKQKSDDSTYYLRVEELYANPDLAGSPTTGALAQSVKLSGAYQGATGTFLGEYTKGEYLLTDLKITDRNDPDLVAAGGNFFWIAARSDTIQAQASIVRTDLTIDLSLADGTKIKGVTGVAHGLVDGDRITIEAGSAWAGTHKVEVESTTEFWIYDSTVSADEIGQTAHYALVATGAYETPDGFQLESAEHNFKNDQRITIAGTSSGYDGTYLINVRSNTVVQIPVATALVPPANNVGTVELPRVEVRVAFGAIKVVQGESIDIGDPDTANILNFIGMDSLSQSLPNYSTPDGYNALNGQQNWNSSSSDNLTERVSKLSAMMADRVQDRGLQFIGRVNITHETNGGNQDVSANGTLTIRKPSSPDETLNLTVSLPANSVAIAEIERDGPGAGPTTLSVESLGSPTLLGENKLLMFYRFSDTTVYTWDGRAIPANGHLNTEYPEDSSNRNVFVFHPGRTKFDQSTGLIELEMLSCAEKTTVDTLAASTLDVVGAARSWLINSAEDATDYYVWYNVTDGANSQVDPATAGTGVRVDVLLADTDDDVAAKTAAVLDLLADFNASSSGPQITVQNTAFGETTDASDVNSSFTISVVEEGVDPDVEIIINGSSNKNIIDVDAINALGTLVVPANNAVWVRVNRFGYKEYNQILTADAPASVDTNVAGALFITPIADVPIDQDVFVLWMRNGDNLVEMHKAVAPDDNVYEERLDIVSGVATNDNELQGPVPANTIIDLPLDSRDGDSAQKYIVGAGLLEIELNGQRLTRGEDWDEVGSQSYESTKIEILQDLVVGDFLVLRIDTQGSVFFASTSASTSTTLQQAYDTGRTITVNSGQPLVITGPGGEKLVRILGDLEVTGVIDPVGLELTPVASNPLSGPGMWVDSADNTLQLEGITLPATNWKTSTQTGTMTTPSNLDEYWIDTSGGVASTTLPPATLGLRVRFIDAEGTWNTNNVTVTGDGSDTFDGVAGPLTLSADNSVVELIGDSNSNWRVVTLK